MSHRSRLANAVPMLVLRAPLLHRLMSSRYLVLEFTGRISGRTFRTPVAYVANGAELVFSTESPWWRNLVAHPQVRVRLRGVDVPARATVVDDPTAAARHLQELVTTIPAYHRAAGLSRDHGVVPDTEIQRAVGPGGRVVLAAELAR